MGSSKGSIGLRGFLYRGSWVPLRVGSGAVHGVSWGFWDLLSLQGV